MLVVAECLDEVMGVPAGSKGIVDVPYNDTISSLKTLVSQKYPELDINTVKLIYRGKVLKDDQRLNEVGIKGGDKVQIRNNDFFKDYCACM